MVLFFWYAILITTAASLILIQCWPLHEGYTGVTSILTWLPLPLLLNRSQSGCNSYLLIKVRNEDDITITPFKQKNSKPSQTDCWQKVVFLFRTMWQQLCAEPDKTRQTFQWQAFLWKLSSAFLTFWFHYSWLCRWYSPSQCVLEKYVLQWWKKNKIHCVALIGISRKGEHDKTCSHTPYFYFPDVLVSCWLF